MNEEKEIKNDEIRDSEKEVSDEKLEEVSGGRISPRGKSSYKDN